MGHSQFTSATLRADGTLEVHGPLRVDPPARGEDVNFRFLIIQGSVVVEGEGMGLAGSWHGTTTAQPGSLQAGAAQAVGVAIVGKKDPPGFETLTWFEQVNLEPAE